MIQEFIIANRQELVRRASAALRSSPLPWGVEISDGVSLFLMQVVDALRLRLRSGLPRDSAAVLGGHTEAFQRFSMVQVVRAYVAIGRTICDYSVESNAGLDGDDYDALEQALNYLVSTALVAYRRRPDSAFSAESQRTSVRSRGIPRSQTG